MQSDDIMEEIKDIQNVTQLLNISIQQEAGDEHIIRSLNLIDKMLATLMNRVVALDKHEK